MLRRLALVFLLAALAGGMPAAAGAARPLDGGGARIEVVVQLDVPPAARWTRRGPGAARSAMARVDRASRALEARLRALVPDARVRWRYRTVLAGLAVVLPAREVGRVSRLSGVRAVYPALRYHAAATVPAGPVLEPARAGRGLADQGPAVIGATALWGANLENAGQGIKIGIIDDGIDPSHPYFDPAGYTPPPGFPKGQRAFTTAKIIVARAFPPAGATWRYAARPFDPVESMHGTHVAGIAAGNANTPVPAGTGHDAGELSGVAPRAFLGNYKVLTVLTDSGVGLDGNSPEIVAAIEAAVNDGMDVINLSLGEPQVDPERDAVALALDNAAAAGVIPVVAAGNDYLEQGAGSVGSPGTSARAITVAATSGDGEIASFSSRGPTPLGLLPKPDVSAPGVAVLSSVPKGRFDLLSGTSMATPAVSGAAALLRQLHGDWSVEQIKAALVLTGRPVSGGGGQQEVSSAREGGGLVDLPAAADPQLFASPQALGYGYLDVSGGPASGTVEVALADAGGGAGEWSVAIELQTAAQGVTLEAPGTVVVPGTLTVSALAAADAAEGERTGFVVLSRGDERRRIPIWLRVTRPRLPRESARTLERPGTYRGDTRGRPALVDRYRYPEPPLDVLPLLRGPEQLFRVELKRPVANLGVAIVDAPRGVTVQPRIVSGADENRLGGATAFPVVDNPYLPTFLERTPVSGVLFPRPGVYSLVFDEPAPSGAGRFTFRYWVDDVTPPSVRLLSRVARNGRIRARVADAGSGVDPDGVFYRVDGGGPQPAHLNERRGVVVVDVRRLRSGRHRLELAVSDRQEAKNTENVPRILPNTRVVRATIRVP